MNTTGSEYGERLHRHIHAFFEGHSAQRHDFDRGPIQRLLPGFHITEISPGRCTGLWTYISIGAGFGDVGAASHLEFLLVAAQPSVRHVELLAMTAHYHRSGERLGLGHTFSIGEPWLPDSALDCLLVSRPYPYGPKLELLEVDNAHVHILWLLPITHAERAYAAANGPEAIEALFDQNAIEYWDSKRASVV